MLELVVLTWLLALAGSAATFTVVVLCQAVARQSRAVASRARRVADDSAVTVTASGASAAQAA